MNLANVIDHTILRPDCRLDEIKKICAEAEQFGFASVCVPPYFIKEAARILEDSKVKVSTVIGFPMGYSTTPAKVEEIKRGINDGVDELDVVVNICAVKEGNWYYVKSDLESMTLAAHLKGKVIKVIFETSILSMQEIRELCNICVELGVDYVKTSTGMNGGGATREIVEFLRAELPSQIKIKASGGIRTAEQAKAFIEAGADRLGTSGGVAIIQEVGV